MNRIMSRRAPWLGLLVAVVAALGLMAGGNDVARAYPGENVTAGHDLVETVTLHGIENYIDFYCDPINADFFDPGSEPFEGQVYLQGAPSGTFGEYSGLEPTDTIIERLDDTGEDFPATIHVEIVQMELVSIDPITVTYGEYPPEDWEVRVQVADGEPTQSPGTMDISHEGADGGTFDIDIPVLVDLIFTRVNPPDYEMRTYQDFGPIEYLASDEPWCHTANPLAVPPGQEVIEVDGLTTNFFPGIDCGLPRTKYVVGLDADLEQCDYAHLDVQAAEKDLDLPTAPHYECYAAPGAAPAAESAIVETQFGEETVPLGAGLYLCPPALKNGEGDLDAPHLRCFNTYAEAPDRVVDLATQFGVYKDVEVGDAVRLCLPAAKEVIEPYPISPEPLAPEPHYLCYEIEAEEVGSSVEVYTQFHQYTTEPEIALVGEPQTLCLPAAKNHEGDIPDTPHLVCYDAPMDAPGWMVVLYSQFFPDGEDMLSVELGEMLCVPALKEVQHPVPVGGIAERPELEPQAAGASSGSSSPPYAAIAALAAAAIAIAASGGWYARRRWRAG